MGSEPPSAPQKETEIRGRVNVGSYLLTRPRFELAANAHFPPFATLSIEKVVENELGLFVSVWVFRTPMGYMPRH